MKEKMNIKMRGGIFAVLLSAFMFTSCTKEELVPEPLKKGPQISFRADAIQSEGPQTKSGLSGYGKKQGNIVLRSAQTKDSLSVGVYVQDGIKTATVAETKGEIITAGNISDFGVYCKLTNNEGATIPYFSNLKVTKNTTTNAWDNDKDYYWPGSDFTTLEFLAVAPYVNGMIAGGDSKLPTQFTYTVPDNAVDQKDILIAKPKTDNNSAEFPGNHNEEIRLTYDHILSAINVKIGTVPEGTINSITLTGIANTGTYTVGSGWNAPTGEVDYMVDFDGDGSTGSGETHSTTGNETGNPQVNATNATFMMLPQTLGSNAKLVVNFTHAVSQNTYPLSAEISGQVWEEGKTTNYLINISPDYKLNIEEESVEISDCHYDTKVINITNQYTNVDWILSSNVDWIKFRLVPADYETNESYATYRDYWIENHTVTKIDITYYQATKDSTQVRHTDLYPITSQLEGSGNAKVLIYYYENTQTSTDETRPATIYLKDSKGNINDQITVLQFNPLWDGNIAYERIEEDKNGYPWGFASTRTVTYTYPSYTKPSWAEGSIWTNPIGVIIWALFGDWIQSSYNETRSEAYTTFYNSYYNTDANAETEFITITGNANSQWTATLNYSKLNNIAATGTGRENTTKILGYTGGSTTGSDAETWLINNNLDNTNETSSSDNTLITQTAVYQAIKKNAWILSTVQTTTTVINEDGTMQGDPVVTIVNEVNLAKSSIQWFLPSSTEVVTLQQTACDSNTENNDEALSGTYWSSTSAASPQSVSYTDQGTTANANRTTLYKVRAARQKD